MGAEVEALARETIHKLHLCVHAVVGVIVIVVIVILTCYTSKLLTSVDRTNETYVLYTQTQRQHGRATRSDSDILYNYDVFHRKTIPVNFRNVMIW